MCRSHYQRVSLANTRVRVRVNDDSVDGVLGLGLGLMMTVLLVC